MGADIIYEGGRDRKKRKVYMQSFIHILEIIINPVMGIIGMILGVIITHHIESKNHETEESKKLLRNLYFKIYTELEYCFLTQNGFINVNVHIGLNKSISIGEINSRMEKLLEDNIDIIDSNLFSLYHKIKYEQYYNDVTGGIAEYEYLEFYASLLKDMRNILKKTKMSNKYLLNIFENLRFEYFVWYSLMKRLLDWEKVKDILIKIFLFKRSFKKIKNSVFANKLPESV